MMYGNFASVIVDARAVLKRAPIVKTERWQGIDARSRPEMATHEFLNYSFEVRSTYMDNDELVSSIKPDLPWADDHFAERVSGVPLNPPPSESYWPHAPKGNDQFKSEVGIFSHTYPERMWPKQAGLEEGCGVEHGGIRFPYGDLGDLVELLAQEPYTRQAYLPIWFPEDLGMPRSERRPCSLGYHFIMRDNQLHIVYAIRSCDFIRHFRNDIYLTVRLQHWVLDQCIAKNDYWERVVPGRFKMDITSLHIFRNDYLKEFADEN